MISSGFNLLFILNDFHVKYTTISYEYLRTSLKAFSTALNNTVQ